MTTTNTNKNYMRGSSVYEIDENVEVKDVNYGKDNGCTWDIDYRKENGCTWDYEKLHLGLFVNQRFSLADLEGFTNIEETERSYNLGSLLTYWDDYFIYHTIAKGIDVVHEKAKHTIVANFHFPHHPVQPTRLTTAQWMHHPTSRNKRN
jgi:hypothetical protein